MLNTATRFSQGCLSLSHLHCDESARPESDDFVEILPEHHEIVDDPDGTYRTNLAENLGVDCHVLLQTQTLFDLPDELVRLERRQCFNLLHSQIVAVVKSCKR